MASPQLTYEQLIAQIAQQIAAEDLSSEEEESSSEEEESSSDEEEAAAAPAPAPATADKSESKTGKGRAKKGAYRLRKAPKRNLYWVVSTDSGEKHSKEPLPKPRAEAQMRALYAAKERRGGMGFAGPFNPFGSMIRGTLAQDRANAQNEMASRLNAEHERAVKNIEEAKKKQVPEWLKGLEQGVETVASLGEQLPGVGKVFEMGNQLRHDLFGSITDTHGAGKLKGAGAFTDALYEILVKYYGHKRVADLPHNIQAAFEIAKDDLRRTGPSGFSEERHTIKERILKNFERYVAHDVYTDRVHGRYLLHRPRTTSAPMDERTLFKMGLAAEERAPGAGAAAAAAPAPASAAAAAPAPAPASAAAASKEKTAFGPTMIRGKGTEKLTKLGKLAQVNSYLEHLLAEFRRMRGIVQHANAEVQRLKERLADEPGNPMIEAAIDSAREHRAQAHARMKRMKSDYEAIASNPGRMALIGQVKKGGAHPLLKGGYGMADLVHDMALAMLKLSPMLGTPEQKEVQKIWDYQDKEARGKSGSDIVNQLLLDRLMHIFEHEIKPRLPAEFPSLSGGGRKFRGAGFLDWLKSKATAAVQTVSNVGKTVVGRVKDVIRGIRVDYPPRVRQLLAAVGDKQIVAMAVRRDPLPAPLTQVLNLGTLGKWDEVRQRYNYDKVFHLALEVVLDMGEYEARYVVEKNQVINIAPATGTSKDTEYRRVQGTPANLNVMLELTKERMGDQAFFKYDAFNNNCQDFIISILSTNNLLTPELQAFIKQPLGDVLAALPSYAERVAKIATDLGGLADVAVQGRGKGKLVTMKPKAFFTEHKKLVAMLNSIGNKLQKEAKDQAMEAKGWAKKLKGGSGKGTAGHKRKRPEEDDEEDDLEEEEEAESELSTAPAFNLRRTALGNADEEMAARQFAVFAIQSHLDEKGMRMIWNTRSRAMTPDKRNRIFARSVAIRESGLSPSDIVRSGPVDAGEETETEGAGRGRGKSGIQRLVQLAKQFPKGMRGGADDEEDEREAEIRIMIDSEDDEERRKPYIRDLFNYRKNRIVARLLELEGRSKAEIEAELPPLVRQLIANSKSARQHGVSAGEMSADAAERIANLWADRAVVGRQRADAVAEDEEEDEDVVMEGQGKKKGRAAPKKKVRRRGGVGFTSDGAALVVDEARFRELLGLMKTKTQWEALRATRPTLQPYEEYAANYINLARQRSLTDPQFAAKSQAFQEERLANVKAYEEFIAEHPEYEPISCRFDEEGNPAARETVPRGECERRHALAMEKQLQSTTMGKIVSGLTKAGDIATELVGNVPGIGKIASSVYKQFAPPGSAFYDPKKSFMEKGVGAISDVIGFGRPVAKFMSQLEKLRIAPDDYLAVAMRKARKLGLNADTLTFSTDKRHKLMIKDDEGDWVHFGSPEYADYILYTLAGDPKADEHRKAYRKRATHIKGKWMYDEYSPNYLAINVIW